MCLGKGLIQSIKIKMTHHKNGSPKSVVGSSWGQRKIGENS